MLSLHCFSLSSSADDAFLAYPGEAGEIKCLFGSFLCFNCKITIWLSIVLVCTHCYDTFTVKAYETDFLESPCYHQL